MKEAIIFLDRRVHISFVPLVPHLDFQVSSIRAAIWSSKNMSTWIISAPANPTKQATISALATRLSDSSDTYPFQTPDFKVGTLDSLIVLSDELIKTDVAVEASVVKIAEALKNLIQNDEQWKQSLLVGDSISLADSRENLSLSRKFLVEHDEISIRQDIERVSRSNISGTAYLIRGSNDNRWCHEN